MTPTLRSLAAAWRTLLEDQEIVQGIARQGDITLIPRAGETKRKDERPNRQSGFAGSALLALGVYEGNLRALPLISHFARCTARCGEGGADQDVIAGVDALYQVLRATVICRWPS